MKDPEQTITEIKDKLYNRLADIRRIKHDFAHTAKIDPLWEGIVGRCGQEERFIVELLESIEKGSQQ